MNEREECYGDKLARCALPSIYKMINAVGSDFSKWPNLVRCLSHRCQLS